MEAIRRIEIYSTDLNMEKFVDDLKSQDSIIRNLEIIGEAVKKITINTKRNNPDIEWRMIADVRNRLIHDYFGVNLDIIWEIIIIDLPILKKQIREINL